MIGKIEVAIVMLLLLTVGIWIGIRAIRNVNDSPENRIIEGFISAGLLILFCLQVFGVFGLEYFVG